MFLRRYAFSPEVIVVDFNALFIFAEVASVFVGFAALGTILVVRSDSPERPIQVFMLISVVQVGGVVLVGALLPSVLAAYPLEDVTVWRVASASF